jgi:hypothetical protein
VTATDLGRSVAGLFLTRLDEWRENNIMLLRKVVYVTQFVIDQDKALDFYTRLLDFREGQREGLSSRALAGETRRGPGAMRRT